MRCDAVWRGRRGTGSVFIMALEACLTGEDEIVKERSQVAGVR